MGQLQKHPRKLVVEYSQNVLLITLFWHVAPSQRKETNECFFSTNTIFQVDKRMKFHINRWRFFFINVNLEGRVAWKEVRLSFLHCSWFFQQYHNYILHTKMFRWLSDFNLILKKRYRNRFSFFDIKLTLALLSPILQTVNNQKIKKSNKKKIILILTKGRHEILLHK